MHEEMRFAVGIPEGRDDFGAVGIDLIIILKWTVKKQATAVDLIHVTEDRIYWWDFFSTV
jgi:hypothetical protein